MHTQTIASVLSLYFVTAVNGITREYFLATVEQEWDYAPGGNLIYTGDQRDADLYLRSDPAVPLPGTRYKKALYRLYTDATFTRQKPVPEWQGMIGPLMHGEIGDVMLIHFQNKASRNYSVHPHGVFYNKDSEGAFYNDGHPLSTKLDDAVPPGANVTYTWRVLPEYGPTDVDPNCITWLYHSHQIAEPEVMTGPIGIMATCKKGVLDRNGKRTDVQREYSLLFAIMDENFSFLRSENIRAANITEQAILDNFITFQLANRKHSINGYIYGNLPGLTACLGDKVSLHLAVIGLDMDLHSIYVQGQTMEIYRHSVDTVGMYPGSSLTAIIDAENPGKWLLSCQDRDYIKAGMQAFFNVDTCGRRPSQGSNYRGTTRYYAIAAEEVTWNYAPSGVDQVDGSSLQNKVSNSFGRATEGNCKMNGIYKKAIYRGYTDGSFRQRSRREQWEEHLGYLGPVIYAEVGDTVVVHFRNLATRNYSIQAYRFFVPHSQNGIQYRGGPNVGVRPGYTKVYTWTVPDFVGPTYYDSDCVYGRYYSAVDQVKDSFTGLNGPIVVCKPGKLNPYNRGIDREFYLFFSNVLETESHYYLENVQRTCGSSREDAEEFARNTTFINANSMRSINGFTYGNLPGLNMVQGECVTWFVTSVGYARGDMHVPYWHGNTFDVDGTRKDTFPLIPDIFKTLIMTPDNPGTWLLEDSVHDYSTEWGMMALYYVRPNQYYQSRTSSRRGITRTYYIGVVEEEWDFVPRVTVNPISFLPIDEDEISRQFYVQGDTRIGHKYIKAIYREFTDGTFTRRKARTARELHMGIVGPFIKAEVGDTIRVVFRNLATRNYSIQAHGVFYDKASEGQGYNDWTSGRFKSDDAIRPGQTYTYQWYVPDRAGPSKDDFNCVVWPYVSGVSEEPDLNAGLCGPIVICKPGTLKTNGLRNDVAREFVLFFYLYNENGSPYLEQNINTYTNRPNDTMQLLLDPDFIESNIMMGINGYSWGSISNVTMYVGEVAAFYVISFGDGFGAHTAHWHGNTFVRRLSGNHRHDVLNVLPGDREVVELLGVNAGTWLLHCHVGNHSESGMLMTYEVLNSPQG